MEATETELDTPTEAPRRRWRNQIIALIVFAVLGLAIFFAVQSVNNDHSYKQARSVCREYVHENTSSVDGVKWRVSYGDNSAEDQTGGSYALPVTATHPDGNEDAFVCMASYRSGNWDVYII